MNKREKENKDLIKETVWLKKHIRDCHKTIFSMFKGGCELSKVSLKRVIELKDEIKKLKEKKR